ncbi:MAG: SH3 domain-containing protein, partial [Treponema sp.]|nr:SH3 domain-containing protein [Treponema sp.]
TLNGDVYYWAGTTINHINYQIYDNKEVNIWNDDELEISCTSPDEEIESIAIHPSGDIYILRMNWKTNTHTLYCIENTWDPEWREQWNNEHINFDNQDSASSTNVAVSKVMTCNDNLRLRSQEATSSSVITTMQKGTKVKILQLGKAETIDGINSNWVQVEILTGAKDKDGKEIKPGTTGWCYGGYLE